VLCAPAHLVRPLQFASRSRTWCSRASHPYLCLTRAASILEQKSTRHASMVSVHLRSNSCSC
jgi:hypothetical protein